MKFIFAMLTLLISLTAQAAPPELLLKVMICESGLRYNVWGDDHKSFGIAQFRKETFYEFAEQAKKEMKTAGFWPPNWQNPQHQLFLLNWGIDNGYSNRWGCYRMIMEE